MSVARVIVRTEGPDLQGGALFDPFVIQTEMERLQSMELARRVAERLDLARAWAGRYEEGLSTSDAAAILRERMDVRQSRNTSVIEIRFYSEHPEEAAEIANAIGKEFSAISPHRVSTIDLAGPEPRPVRPNVPLNLALGAGGAAVLGFLVASFLVVGSLVFPMLYGFTGTDKRPA
jgi:uncharacterized protein involved in exopolysaccharide biosynthesis